MMIFFVIMLQNLQIFTYFLYNNIKLTLKLRLFTKVCMKEIIFIVFFILSYLLCCVFYGLNFTV